MSELPRVFISYRRAPSLSLAQRIYDDLHRWGYDVFLDRHTLGGGRFDLRLLDEIKNRYRFVLLLAPDTLKRCFGPSGQPNPEDYVRREIECALANERVIVPVLHDGFSFGQHASYFTGTFKHLSKHNAVFLARRSRWWFRSEIKPADFQTAMDKLNKYLKSTSAEEYDQQAFEQCRRGNMRSALEYYGEALIASKYDSQRAQLHFKRAELYRSHRNYPAAIADYDGALRMGYSKPMSIYSNRGLAYYLGGDYANAIADLSQAVALEPSPVNYNNRAEALFAAGDYVAARDDFERAVRDDESKNPMFLAGLAVSHFALGEKEAARQIWHELLQRNECYRDAAWWQSEFNWADALAQTARQLVEL